MDRRESHRRPAGISGNTLKIIAIISMFLDHAAIALIAQGVLFTDSQMELDKLLQTPKGAEWQLVYRLLRIVGRIAFPIFCFLLSEGYQYTKNRKKYAFRLFLFALISEAPFNLLVSGHICAPAHQNVYFTLFIGLMTLIGYEACSGNYIRQMIAVAAGFLAAYVLRTDYDVTGIAMILILHLLRNEKKEQLLAGAVLGALESAGQLGGGALAFIPVWRYNGQRGSWNLKYFFYWFYPVHLLLLAFIRNLIFAPAFK